MDILLFTFMDEFLKKVLLFQRPNIKMPGKYRKGYSRFWSTHFGQCGNSEDCFSTESHYGFHASS